jgi:DNA-binding transcriptional MerR regulator
MSSQPVSIPEKLFFKIGEVCELAGVQAHVLRYWESEFPMLAPQKNRAGQRVYRKRDVEMALRIKELLYEDQYTIAGAKKRLANDLRGGPRVKSGSADTGEGYASSSAPDNHGASRSGSSGSRAHDGKTVAPDRDALRKLASELRELLSMLDKETHASAPPKK